MNENFQAREQSADIRAEAGSARQDSPVQQKLEQPVGRSSKEEKS
jgi:hypothetical protein